MSARPSTVITIPLGPIARALVLFVAVVAVATVALFAKDQFFPTRGLAAQIDPSRYQAVVLRGGQVYYGHADASASDVLLLRDVYYLANVTESTPRGQLIKRGSEVHGPIEPMIIPANEVAFIENIRDDSEVGDAIKRFLGGEQPVTPAPQTPPPATPAPTPESATSTPATATPRPSPSPTR